MRLSTWGCCLAHGDEVEHLGVRLKTWDLGVRLKTWGSEVEHMRVKLCTGGRGCGSGDEFEKCS